MNKRAGKALATIRQCVADGRFVVLQHFTQRMEQRGLFWSDVLTVLDNPGSVSYAGYDRYHRPKWIISGRAADGLPIKIVCVLDKDDFNHMTVFITFYRNRVK